MKRLAALILILPMLAYCSCAQYEPEGAEAILDSLVIQTWVLDEQFEGNGTWMYEKPTRENGFNKDEGYWLSDDGERLTGDDVFVYERLEVGKPRILAPVGYHYRHHLTFRLGSDDLIKVEIPSDEGNQYIHAGYAVENPDDPWNGVVSFGKSFEANGPFTIEVRPLGKFGTARAVRTRHTLAGQEYYINITTYGGDGTPIIEAKLKLTSIDDPAYPFPEEGLHSPGNWSIYMPTDNMTRFLVVELLEYGFSEKYRIEYGIPDSEEVTEAPEDTLVGYY